MLRWLIGRPDQDEVRLPVLKDDFQSTVPGLHIVGDLAGAPTIRVAANQGHDVMHHIAGLPDGRAEVAGDVHDVVIVGGGSSGIAAALEANKHDLNVVVLDSGRLANTIREFPKKKEIYAEPAAVPNRSQLWLEDSVKEELLEKWDEQLTAADLNAVQCEEVTDIRRVPGAFEVVTAKGRTFKGRRVLLAIGKRGNPRRLGVPGEDLPKVSYKLYDPEDLRGEKVLVVGGGDSAVEAALALSEVAEVTLSYRKDTFFRLKSKNREKIDEAAGAGRVTILFGSSVGSIEEGEVVLDVSGEERRIGNDCVIVAIGAELPHRFFKKIGIRMEKEWPDGKIVALAAVLAIFWLIYSAKHFPPLFPWSAFDLGWDDFQLGRFHWYEWYAFAYSAATVIFGVRAMRRWWYSKLQRAKYLTILVSQVLLLTVLPILVAPAVAPEWFPAGHFFSLVMAWPLSFKAIPAPWIDGQLAPFLYAVGLTFLVFPVAVYYFGSRFCSWVCGCGCLAETLGDEVRHLAPRGPKSIRFERAAGRIVLALATIATVYTMFMVSWGSAAEASKTGKLALLWYGIAVDVTLAGAVGLAFYWFMGNRIWCRFFCPLRMYMNLIGSIASRFKIVSSKDKCIACGQCSRQCQMGIPVMDFAKRGEAVTLKTSSCIGCGVCVDVCPVDVLHYSEAGAKAAEPVKQKEPSAV
ncbi:MAG: NAD(P)-binding domain-containing protein [Planctomycetota bacterium]|jgi:thioredoxin reductase/polyferredoxin